MERLLFVSIDSHAQMPSRLWAEYLDPAYRGLLPGLLAEQARYVEAVGPINAFTPEMLSLIDDEHVIDDGEQGFWDRDRRIREMDREGVAAEVVFSGHFRAMPLLFSPGNEPYPVDARIAGVRANDRWSAERLIGDDGRTLCLGHAGAIPEIDTAVRHLEWLAAHGFTGTMCPRYTADPQFPKLGDTWYDPFWKTCVDNGLCVAIHAGHNLEQGELMRAIDKLTASLRPGEDIRTASQTEDDEGFIFSDLRPREALTQLLLGGVFDRFPDLRIMFTEVRGDWLPATLDRLDAVWERDIFPAKRRPSEYWHTNCAAGLSFIHRAEVEIRDQIGVETMMFGRDYPHTEGTWPKTREYVQAAFAGVGADDVRAMLGGNAVRFLGLDAERLHAISARIGPDLADVMSPATPVSAQLLDVFQKRSGFAKPIEQLNIAKIDAFALACATTP